MGTGPVRAENRRKKQSPKGLERGQNSSLPTGNQPQALQFQGGWAFASLIAGTCEFQIHLNCGGSCAIAAKASAGWQPHRQRCCWECQGCAGLAMMLLQSHFCPSASLPTRGWCWGASGLTEWEAKRQPNPKVMEDSQDQREEMNFKHVPLCFGKAETLK